VLNLAAILDQLDLMCSISPQSSTTTGWRVAPPPLPTFSIASTTSRPDDTLPKTTCFPSKCGVERVVRKNCEPFVLGPALALESRNGYVWQT